MSDLNIEQVLSAKKAIYSKMIDLLENKNAQSISGEYKHLGDIEIKIDDNTFEKNLNTRLNLLKDNNFEILTK